MPPALRRTGVKIRAATPLWAAGIAAASREWGDSGCRSGGIRQRRDRAGRLKILSPQDFAYQGVASKKDDLIQVPISLHGLDDRRWESPWEVDFNRPASLHATFGNGPHRCPGSSLARTEVRVFLQE